MLPMKNRMVAFALHAMMSFVVFLALYIIARHYYPGAFFFLADGATGLKFATILACIPYPFLTAVAIKKNKKLLKLDLTIIGLMQLAAVIFSIKTIYAQRPLAAVVAAEKIYILRKEDLPHLEQNIDSIIGKTPSWHYVDLPLDKAAAIAVSIATELVNAKGLASRSDLYKAATIDGTIPSADFISYLQFFGTEKKDCIVLKLAESAGNEDICVLTDTGKINISGATSE